MPPGGPTELRSLAASFNAMLARLGRSAADRERALAATRRFAADAGHELRTPLTSVQATLSTLERHLDLPPERRAEMLGDALAEQRRLVELLDGLQALARGDAGPLELTEVDLAEVVDAAAAAAVERHPGLDLSAELPDAPVAIEGWEPGLRLLADNLVENAVRHGRPHGHIRVTLDAPPDGEDGGGAVLTVDDDGPGIADADRERIFAPFARLESTNGEGSGLGLALVQQQVRHHGARIDVGESPLGGARFSVRFARRGPTGLVTTAPGGLYNPPPLGRVAQWESARFTRERSQVRNPPRPSSWNACLCAVSCQFWLIGSGCPLAPSPCVVPFMVLFEGLFAAARTLRLQSLGLSAEAHQLPDQRLILTLALLDLGVEAQRELRVGVSDLRHDEPRIAPGGERERDVGTAEGVRGHAVGQGVQASLPPPRVRQLGGALEDPVAKAVRIPAPAAEVP